MSSRWRHLHNVGIEFYKMSEFAVTALISARLPRLRPPEADAAAASTGSYSVEIQPHWQNLKKEKNLTLAPV